jgi:hypothetical protein
MTLAAPAGVTPKQVGDAILSAVSVAYGISPELLIVNLVALPAESVNASSRRLLQATGTRYAVEIIVLFPPAASAADVSRTQNSLASIDSTKLNVALGAAPTDLKITVLSSTLREVRTVQPTLSPPMPGTTPGATPGTTPGALPDATPGVQLHKTRPPGQAHLQVSA